MARTLMLGLAAAIVASAAHAQAVMRQEPPMGQLRSGEVVLVDNGKCPRGQIQQVTGGSANAGAGSQVSRGGVRRSYRCVPRP